MTSVFDVPAAEFINRVAEDFKKDSKITPPEWAKFVKTGSFATNTPENPDWWYIRAAALLRRIYIDGPVGVMRLRTLYGGRKNRGIRPHIHKPAGGKIIRTILQQLENKGYVTKKEGGRVLTPAGQKYADKIATQIIKSKKD